MKMIVPDPAAFIAGTTSFATASAPSAFTRQAVSTWSRRRVALCRRRAATPATRAFPSASVPTWLSNGPTPSALTTNDSAARSASGESRLSVTART